MIYGRHGGCELDAHLTEQVDYVDVRYGVPLDERTVDLVLAVDVPHARLHFLSVDAASRQVAPLPGAAIGTPMPYSLGGKQFIAITVQGRAATDIPELVVLALP